MKTTNLMKCLGSAIALLCSASLAGAKDKPVLLEECPEPVQAVIRKYQAEGTLEEIGLDENKKSGGPSIYEAKFTLTEGRRIELHITPDGSIQAIEKKKRKK